MISWLVAGTAGEGLETAGELFAKTTASLGQRPITQRDFPSRIRGGDTTFTVRLARGHLTPSVGIDLALAFNETVLEPLTHQMHGHGIILIDEGLPIPDCDATVMPIPFTALAKEAGHPRQKNMVALGISCRILGLDPAAFRREIEARFADAEQNLHAFKLGYEFPIDTTFETPEAQDGEAWLLSGNQAVALAALHVGCQFVAAYPITPASDILEFMTPRMDGIALQLEDEMAALNACVGAAFSGARALTATSGPGLSLMTETLGMAASTEIPVVIVNCQRPGPSTGMPTKHGQEDLWHMALGGHGEDVRIVMSPTNVEDAYHSTREVFRLAEAHRAPAILALDQQLSLFKQTTPPLSCEPLPPRPAPRTEGNAWQGTYKPYGDGPSWPGDAGGIHYANSTEHAPSGFTTESREIRVAMVDRRKRIMQNIVDDCQDPVIVEGSGDKILLAWGSTVEACREAQIRFKEEGVDVQVVAIRLLWPFPVQAIKDALGNKPVSVIEANAFGQLAMMVRSLVRQDVQSFTHYDGTPVTSSFVMNAWKNTTLQVKP